MGNLYEFKCEHCGFNTTCSNGRDRGFTSIVQPLYCSECKTLKNIHIGDYVREEGPLTGNRIKNVLPICKTCNSGEYLKLWDGKTCPCCFLEPMLYRDTWIVWD